MFSSILLGIPPWHDDRNLSFGCFPFFLRGMKPATQQTVPKKDVDMGLGWAPQIPNDFPRFYDQHCDKAHLSF